MALNMPLSADGVLISELDCQDSDPTVEAWAAIAVVLGIGGPLATFGGDVGAVKVQVPRRVLDLTRVDDEDDGNTHQSLQSLPPDGTCFKSTTTVARSASPLALTGTVTGIAPRPGSYRGAGAARDKTAKAPSTAVVFW